jgi:hypothetical protein
MFKQFSHHSPPDDGRPERCPLVAHSFLTGPKSEVRKKGEKMEN